MSKSMQDITSMIYADLQNESTKIARAAFDVLDREGIAGIVRKGNVFWFEYYTYGNDCPKYVYNYLKRFIRRKYGLMYLYDATDLVAGQLGLTTSEVKLYFTL